MWSYVVVEDLVIGDNCAPNKKFEAQTLNFSWLLLTHGGSLKSNIMNAKKVDEAWNPESALDVLIALLYAKGSEEHVGEPIEGITRLDKIIYLLSESPEFEPIVNKGYAFEADKFGPFAPEIFDDIAALKQEGIIKVVSTREPKDKIETIDEETIELVLDEVKDANKNVSWKTYSVERYELTNRGLEIGSLLYNGLTEKQKTRLEEIKKTFGKMSLKNLLHYVYSKYPKMTEKSKIKDKILYKK